MIPDAVFAGGQVERFKGLVHAVMFALATTMWGYNVAAWLARREAHLRTNVVLYAALMGYELRQVARHLRD